LRQGLLFGYFPGFPGIYWDNSTLYERDRSLFRLYMPLIKTIHQAGWNPVNYTTSPDPSIMIERFGNPSAGAFYITAQNTGTATSSPQFTIDGAGLGISSTATVTARELVSNTAVSVSRSGSNLTLSDSLAAGETSLYKMTVSGTSSAPVAQFTFSPSPGLVGQTIQFTDTSTNSPTSWSWSFSDPNSGSANTSTLRNPTHVFSAAGSYQVYLTATNAAGSSIAGHSVTINVGVSAPVASFTFSPSPRHVGQTIQFTDTSTNSPTSWSWSFGDPNSGSANTSTLRNPTHVFSAAGSYMVNLTATNAAGSSIAGHTVIISP